MRRIAGLILASALVASGSLEATAGWTKSRNHVVPYVGSATMGPSGTFNCVAADEMTGYPGVGCVYHLRLGRDAKVSARIEDASGLDTSGWLVQNRQDPETGAYTWSKVDRFCTESGRVPIHPRTTHIFVALWQTHCLDGTPAASTMGEVTFTVWTS